MQCTIRDRWTGRVLTEGEFDDLRACVVAKAREGADLRGADLRGADLRGAYLRGADLRGADLQGAYLQGADLQGAYLQGAYLRGADLQGAYLQGAYLQGAYLQGLRDDARARTLVGERPFLQIGPIGSRQDVVTLWITDGGPIVQAGCFYGTIDEFVAKVERTHGTNVHAEEYLAVVALFRIHVAKFPRNERDDVIAAELATAEAAKVEETKAVVETAAK